MTATTSTSELEESLKDLVRRYGEYPHAKIDTSKRKKQTTRMLKVECLDCGTAAYQSNKQLEENPIKCLHCDEILYHYPKDWHSPTNLKEPLQIAGVFFIYSFISSTNCHHLTNLLSLRIPLLSNLSFNTAHFCEPFLYPIYIV